MKKTTKRLMAMLLALLMGISVIVPTDLTVEAATGPKLAKKTASVVIGGTSKIKLKNVPANSTVTYKSAKKSVATVSKKGTVKGIKGGSAKITVSVKTASKTKKLTYKVTVKKPKLSKSSLSLTEGGTATLSVKNKPKKAGYVWSSGNQEVADVDGNGEITAKAEGKTNIKVKVKTAKKTYSLSCKVTVKPIPKEPEVVAQTYTVTFDSNGGSAVDLQTVQENAAAVCPADPSRSGYTFDGWYTAAAGGTKYDFSAAVAEDITLYARWTKIEQEGTTPTPTPTPSPSPTPTPSPTPLPSPSSPTTYTVSFDSNGGSTVAFQSVKANGTATEPADPTKEGYIFGGWYLDSACTKPYDFSAAVVSSFTLYAKWIVYDEEADIISEALSNIMIGYSNGDNSDCVSHNISLPGTVNVEGVAGSISITWSSNRPEAISTSGAVVRGSSDVAVSLSAQVSYGGKSDSKDFALTVIKENMQVPTECHSIEELQQFSPDGTIPDVYINEDSELKNIDGVFSNIKVFCCDDAIKAIKGIKDIIGITDPDTELKGIRSAVSEDGNVYSLQQMYKGIPVYGRTIGVSTSTDGKAEFLYNSYLPGISISVTPVLNESEIRNILDEGYSTYIFKGLCVYSIGDYMDNPVLTYIVEGYRNPEILEDTLYVDSANGTVVYKNAASMPIMGMYETHVGSGKDELNVDRTFPVYKWFSNYYMEDPKTTGIQMYIRACDWKNVWQSENIIKKGNNSSWDSKYANSAYANTIQVWNWYKDNLGYTSNSNGGKSLKVVLDYYALDKYGNQIFDNAMWHTYNAIYIYPLSDPNPTRTYAAGLDTFAHEFTHGVFINRATGGDSDLMAYEKLTGAIHEAYADIFACIIDGNWTIGEDYKTPYMRDIADPNASGQPEKYKGYYWQDINNSYDNGGVHHNSTVLSHAAYLMWDDEGRRPGLSWKELTELWYKSMVEPYDSDSNFTTVRANVTRVANKIFGWDSEKAKIVATAFDKVNVQPYKVSGKTVIADLDTKRKNNTPLAGVTVSLNDKMEIKKRY